MSHLSLEKCSRQAEKWTSVRPWRAGAPGRNLAVNFWYPTVSAVLRLVMDGMEEDAF
jgi:hypothetical protein